MSKGNRRTRNPKSKVIGVRLSASEYKAMQYLSNLENVTISLLARELITSCDDVAAAIGQFNQIRDDEE